MIVELRPMAQPSFAVRVHPLLWYTKDRTDVETTSIKIDVPCYATIYLNHIILQNGLVFNLIRQILQVRPYIDT